MSAGNAGGTINVTFDHNTFTTPDSNGPYSNSVFLELSGTHQGLVFQNNIGPLGTYGVYDIDFPPHYGMLALSEAYPTGYTFTNNVLWGSEGPNAYPPNNPNPPDVQTIAFVDYFKHDFHLSATSPYLHSGIGGTTPGVNQDLVPTEFNW